MGFYFFLLFFFFFFLRFKEILSNIIFTFFIYYFRSFSLSFNFKIKEAYRSIKLSRLCLLKGQGCFIQEKWSWSWSFALKEKYESQCGLADIKILRFRLMQLVSFHLKASSFEALKIVMPLKVLYRSIY